MAIESHFYDTVPGVGINEVEWAEAAQSRRSLYGVASASELLCTPHASTPYTVNISPAPKGFWGHGVWDTSDAVVTITFTPPANGARRFDLVVARRDWTATGGGPTVLRGVQGSSARALPGGRLSKPGEIDDQPLWLVEWLGGQTQPQSITDLRLIGGLELYDSLGLKYLEFPGHPVKSSGSLWYYEAIGNGNWAHRGYPLQTAPLQVRTVRADGAVNAQNAERDTFFTPFPNGVTAAFFSDQTFYSGSPIKEYRKIDLTNGRIRWRLYRNDSNASANGETFIVDITLIGY
jgi:hypothetical protein